MGLNDEVREGGGQRKAAAAREAEVDAVLVRAEREARLTSVAVQVAWKLRGLPCKDLEFVEAKVKQLLGVKSGPGEGQG